MEVLTEDQIERVLEWYEKDPGEDLVGDEVLTVSRADLVALFRPDDDDPDMHLAYEVEPHEAARLQESVAHRIDLGAYDYFVAAYRKSGGP